MPNQTDNDAIVLEDLAATIVRIDIHYRRADFNDKVNLKPERDRAFNAYTQARLKLLEEGVVCTAADIEKMKSIRQAIVQAKTTQSLITGIGRLVGFLAAL